MLYWPSSMSRKKEEEDKKMKINAQRETLRTGRLDTCEVPTQGNKRISNIYKKKRKKEVNKTM